jgi:hypothetical protein
LTREEIVGFLSSKLLKLLREKWEKWEKCWRLLGSKKLEGLLLLL